MRAELNFYILMDKVMPIQMIEKGSDICPQHKSREMDT